MKTIFITTTLLVIGTLNGLIIQKEQFLSSNESVYLELAPADPRSLMQGDYMALNYAISNAARSGMGNDGHTDGHIIVAVDERGVGQFRRIDRGEQQAADERRIRFRLRGWRVRIGAESFFFQEGHGPAYAKAKYGELKVAPDGECLLVRLCDQELKEIKPD
jgi:uncharacterized membrane-anchored protein